MVCGRFIKPGPSTGHGPESGKNNPSVSLLQEPLIILGKILENIGIKWKIILTFAEIGGRGNSPLPVKYL